MERRAVWIILIVTGEEAQELKRYLCASQLEQRQQNQGGANGALRRRPEQVDPPSAG